MPSVPVRDMDEVINDAGMHERGMLHWMDHPEVGRAGSGNLHIWDKCIFCLRAA
ncbi:MAG: hypothetical protein ACK4Y5_07805 [Acetobacteraceae bacterium]